MLTNTTYGSGKISFLSPNLASPYYDLTFKFDSLLDLSTFRYLLAVHDQDKIVGHWSAGDKISFNLPDLDLYPGDFSFSIYRVDGRIRTKWLIGLIHYAGVGSVKIDIGKVSDEIEIDNAVSETKAASSLPGDITFGTTKGTVCEGNDGRLSDTRMPRSHSHSPADVTGTAIIDTDPRLSDARTPKAHAHEGVYEPANANIQTHVTSTHAPATAQKNSDITQAEILAKLDDTNHRVITDAERTAWNAANPSFNSVYRTLLDSTGSHIAAKVAGTYGIPQGNPLAVTGTGTLYALNAIYFDSADFPTIDGKATKLRVRAVIECNDVAPFTGTFTIGLHPVTRPATSGGAGLCIYSIGAAVAGSTVVGTNLAADSQNNLVGSDFALPANGFYVLAVVTSATMATSSHVHISACLQIHNV